MATVVQIGKIRGEFVLKMVIPAKTVVEGFLLREADVLGFGSLAHAEFTNLKGWIMDYFILFYFILVLKWGILSAPTVFFAFV